jgi:predicted ATPase/DNA-binding winged helix-turn-helix (wHTH) protein
LKNIPSEAHRTYWVDEVVLDLDRGNLQRAGREVKLRPRAFLLLATLMERHGRLVSKEELMRVGWPGTFVSDESLARCITDIRKALADDAHSIVKTVARRGYIFDRPIEARGFDDVARPLPDVTGDGSLQQHPPHGNLTAPDTSFVGRRSELPSIVERLGQARLVTLVGPGGCGKTRLAIKAASVLADSVPDGVWLIDCAPLTDGRLVTEAVATAMDVRPSGSQSMLDRLAAFIGSKSMLLVLDNCEHLRISCAGLTVVLLQSSPMLRILATSREPLAVPREHALQISGLALPPSDASVTQIADADAVKLYVSRASLLQPSLPMTPDTLRTVSSICHSLDGLPLAIELAAARGKVLSVDQIATRLNDRFRLLVGGSPTVSSRQQTLRATIDWSYDSLGPAEQRLMRRLSVFQGGWTIEAAAAVCDEHGDEFETIELLARLIDKSLIFAADDSRTGRRYRMLETVQHYSRDRLEESGDVEAVRRRHFDWCAQLAIDGARALRGHAQATWLRRFNREHDNLRKALEWATSDNGRADSALALAANLWKFWFMGGHLHEGERWLTKVLSRTEPPRLRNLAAAECWLGFGLTTVLLGQPKEGARHLATSLRLSRELGSDGLAVIALRMMTHGLIETGEVEAAHDCAVEACELGRRLGTGWERGAAFGCMGLVSRARQAYGDAARWFAEEIECCRVDGDRWFRVAALSDIAEAELQRGHTMAAADYVREGMSLVDEQATPAVAWIVDVLARLVVLGGDAALAARLWGGSEQLREKTGLALTGYWVASLAEAVRTARMRLGDDERFHVLWQEGRRLRPPELMALANAAAADMAFAD